MVTRRLSSEPVAVYMRSYPQLARATWLLRALRRQRRSEPAVLVRLQRDPAVRYRAVMKLIRRLRCGARPANVLVRRSGSPNGNRTHSRGEAMKSIEINGRQFSVESIALDAALAAKGHRIYGLTGKRGAQYAAVQYINDRELFHVIGIGNYTPARFFDGVVLTDAAGELEVKPMR